MKAIPILKLRIYSVKVKLPRLKFHDRSLQKMSDTVIVYWRWKDFPSGEPGSTQKGLGHYLKSPDGYKHWQVYGATGNLEVLAWGYIKDLP
jgi:hypothetical protein